MKYDNMVNVKSNVYVKSFVSKEKSDVHSPWKGHTTTVLL